MRDWSGQKVVIVGVARQGTALARYLVRHGAQVILNDRRSADELKTAQESLQDLSDADLPLEWVLGEHPTSLLDGADLICLSGGVPLSLPLVVEAQARGIPLSNDSQIFMEAVPCDVIGITGSAGKTTTTTLVGRMAQAALHDPKEKLFKRRVWVGGNIGSPLISVIDDIREEDQAIVEFSSFQLELMTLAPQVAAVLNITPNHLDRHGTMDAYISAKARILDYQPAEGVAILGRDDPGAWSLFQRARGTVWSFGLKEFPVDQIGTYYRDEAIYLHQGEAGSRDIRLITREEISLRGKHNLLNVMAACTIAAAAGFSASSMRSGMDGFTGVPHRLEFVRCWNGADWYNDSIATAPERAIAAMCSFDEPLVLLAGGRDKDLPWDDFAALVQRRVDHLIVFGEAANKILQALDNTKIAETGLIVTQCNGLQSAVHAAAELVQPGQVVLLSPGGTSFDEFSDFEERGECFAQWVKELP